MRRESQELAECRSLSELAREVLRERVEQLERCHLARELEAGYRAESETPSLDTEWSIVDTEDL